MKKLITLIMYFILTGINFASPLPLIPARPDISTWYIGTIFNTTNSVVKTVTYGICEFTPADTQHQAVVCLPPFYTENIESGKYINVFIPKDLLDAQGNVITHYTANITQIKSKELTWLSGWGVSCGMDISKNLNAILLNESETAITCEAGTLGFLAKSNANNSTFSSVAIKNHLNTR